MSATMVGRLRKFWFPESLEWPLNRFLGIILNNLAYLANSLGSLNIIKRNVMKFGSAVKLSRA